MVIHVACFDLRYYETNGELHMMGNEIKKISCLCVYQELNHAKSLILGLDVFLRKEELVGTDNRIVIGNSINEKPFLQMPLMQMMGKNPHRNCDTTYTFDEKWTTQNVLRLSQTFMEPILKVRIHF